MNIQVAITIDTEEDNWGQFNEKAPSIENIYQIPRLQSLFDRFGVKPTYLLTAPVIRDKQSCSIFKKINNDGRCELGLHCHPWNTPPIEEKISDKNSMLCNLNSSLINKKLRYLFTLFEDCFDSLPNSFRAGRWAINQNVVQSLTNLGIHVDTSVSPLVDWSKYYGPDHFFAKNEAFFYIDRNYHFSDAPQDILEIPPTIGFLQGTSSILSLLRYLFAKKAFTKFHLVGLLEKFNLLNLRWLSPELSNAEDIIKLAQTMIRANRPVLNFTFHSTTLLPGMSPFVKNESDLRHFYASIESFLSYAVEEKLKFSTLSEISNVLARQDAFTNNAEPN